MKLYTYDHLEPGSPGLKKILEKAETISIEINRKESADKDFKTAELVIGHYEDDDIKNIIRGSPGFDRFPDKQVVIFITTQPGFPGNPEFKHAVITCKDKQRAVLFVRNMNTLTHDDTIKKMVKITFSHAKDIIANRNHIFNNDTNPFNPQIKKITVSSRWKMKNRAFRHDWLQYFIQDIKAFIKTGNRDFSLIEKRFLQWKTGKRKQANQLIEQLENEIGQPGDPKYDIKINEAFLAIKKAEAAYKICMNRVSSRAGARSRDFHELKQAFNHLSRVFQHLEK